MIWTIHLPEGSNELLLAQAVPEENAPWALLAPPFWLAAKRLWFALLVYALGSLIGLLALGTSLAIMALVLGALPGVYLYLEGQQLRRIALDRKGYLFSGVVEAPDEETAIALFAARRPAPVPRAPLPDATPRSSGETFGLFGA